MRSTVSTRLTEDQIEFLMHSLGGSEHGSSFFMPRTFVVLRVCFKT
jgi:hypothetical protein